ncbi:MAG: phytoene desaturase family protein [Planctomycetota bacterium]|jgi:phytoene desaturase
MKNGKLKKKIAIIGGGLGGLATAVRLSASGHEVTLCEGSKTFGGKMNHWHSNGFTFDTGPSLITMPEVFRETFKAADERMEDHLELVRLDPVADYIWPDGTRFQHGTNLPHWLDVIRNLDRRDVDGFMRFLKLGARLFEVSNETFLRRGVSQPPDWRTIKAIRHLPLRRAWGNYYKVVRTLFRSPYLRQMFNRYPTYVGSSPYKCPATLLVIPYLEFAFGGWFVNGGLYRIVESLVKIARSNGASMLTEAPVERISHQGGRVTSIHLVGGQRIEADAVVMNGDASYLPGLLGNEDAELEPSERSMSGFLSLVATKKDLPSLHHHTVCFSADYEHEFKQIGEGKFPSDPTVYINAPSRSDRSIVPENGETLFIMANTPARTKLWDTGQIANAWDGVVERITGSGLPDFREDSVLVDHWTPRRIADRYTMPGGAIYGKNSHGWRNAFMRPRNQQKKRGLYLVGGSSHPGGGTPTVLMSAKIISNLIVNDEGF